MYSLVCFFFVMMKNIYVFRKLISNMAVNMYFSKIINWPEERNEPFAPRVSSDLNIFTL